MASPLLLQLLLLLAVAPLLLLLLLPAASANFSDLCHGQPCPEYQVLESHEDFQVRRYPPTVWISTPVEGTDLGSFMAARSRLKDYCGKLESKGQARPDGWPSIITVTEGTDGRRATLSWFVPPTVNPPTLDTLVTVERREAAVLFVRSFGGFPSMEQGQANAEALQDSLVKAGRVFDPHTYIGASYDTYFSLTHHNEVWILSA